MTGCISKPKAQSEIILPPMPERTEMPEPTNLKEVAELLNYYEHLVEQWETWGEVVTRMVEYPSQSGK